MKQSNSPADLNSTYPNQTCADIKHQFQQSSAHCSTQIANMVTALNHHSWVNHCYIAHHPTKPYLVAWIELNDVGIRAFRDKGRESVIEELKSTFTKKQMNMAMLHHWHFTDHIPLDNLSKISDTVFEKVCLNLVTDPIWLSEHIEADWQIFRGKVPLDLSYFSGHFANFPLVPGVVEMQWVMDKIHAYFGEEKPILRVDNLKFQKFLRPNDLLELRLKWDEVKNRMAFQLKTDDEMCGSGLVVFGICKS